MRLSTSLLALATFSQAILAQSQSDKHRSLTHKDGFSTTRIFAPFYIMNGGEATLSSSGPENATTTWFIGNEGMSTVTLGPNTAMNTILPLLAVFKANGTGYTSATRITNCAYTPASGSQPMTAECLGTTQYPDAGATSTVYATTTYPRPANETTNLPGYIGLENGKVTAWDGMVDVYVTVTDGKVLTSTEEGGNVVTKTQGAGLPQVTAMVQAVVVMAVGAAAMAV